MFTIIAFTILKLKDKMSEEACMLGMLLGLVFELPFEMGLLAAAVFIK
jgi:hypothetical protein